MDRSFHGSLADSTFTREVFHCTMYSSLGLIMELWDCVLDVCGSADMLEEVEESLMWYTVKGFGNVDEDESKDFLIPVRIARMACSVEQPFLNPYCVSGNATVLLSLATTIEAYGLLMTSRRKIGL